METSTAAIALAGQPPIQSRKPFYQFRDLQPVWGFPWTADHVRRLVREGKFPRPIPKKSRSVHNLWAHDDLARHAADMLAEREEIDEDARAAAR